MIRSGIMFLFEILFSVGRVVYRKFPRLDEWVGRNPNFRRNHYWASMNCGGGNGGTAAGKSTPGKELTASRTRRAATDSRFSVLTVEVRSTGDSSATAERFFAAAMTEVKTPDSLKPWIMVCEESWEQPV